MQCRPRGVTRGAGSRTSEAVSHRGRAEMNPQEYAARGAQPEEQIPVTTTTTRQYRDTQVDGKLVLCALWIAMLFVSAYVDIFMSLRADVLKAALDGKVATTGFTVNQVFLLSLIHI